MNGPLLSILVVIAAVLAWPGPSLKRARDRALYCLGLISLAAILIATVTLIA
ncbi:MAG TPA: hypothetical protein VNX29_04335 [Kaistia sp.]|nr:hypothetical protein [Kaistia sp.]